MLRASIGNPNLLMDFQTYLQKRQGDCLREINGEFIPYYTYTCGALANASIHEGLALCNDMKLRNQLRFQRLTEKKLLGEYFQQFAYDQPCTRQAGKKKDKGKKPYFSYRKKEEKYVFQSCSGLKD